MQGVGAGVTWRALREARRYLAGAVLVELALLALGRPVGRVLTGAAVTCLVFFRDPSRPGPREDAVVYAAADGVVVGVEPAQEPWLGDQEAVRISTFLSLHNVHVNRSPVAGRVAEAEELPGSFAPALLGRAGENHRRRMAIDGERGRVVIVQVAGAVARRIALWVRIGNSVAAGERIGLIHFGSRTDVLLPAGSVEVSVSRGDRVRGGVSALARYRGEGAACGSSSQRRTWSPAAA